MRERSDFCSITVKHSFVSRLAVFVLWVAVICVSRLLRLINIKTLPKVKKRKEKKKALQYSILKLTTSKVLGFKMCVCVFFFICVQIVDRGAVFMIASALALLPVGGALGCLQC